MSDSSRARNVTFDEERVVDFRSLGRRGERDDRGLIANICVVAFGVTLALAGCSEEPQPGAVYTLSGAAIAKVRLDPAAATAKLNGYRAENGLNALRLDPALTAMAERQAQAMAQSGTMSHDVAGSLSARLAASESMLQPEKTSARATRVSPRPWRAGAPRPATTPICSCPAPPGLALRWRRTRTMPTELIGRWKWAQNRVQGARQKWCGFSRFL